MRPSQERCFSAFTGVFSGLCLPLSNLDWILTCIPMCCSSLESGLHIDEVIVYVQLWFLGPQLGFSAA